MKAMTTGRTHEMERLGNCAASAAQYMPFRQAVAFAMASQPSQKPACAMHLEHLVREILGATVVFCTAVGTPLDTFHGVDFFFTMDGDVVLTCDLTANPAKDVGEAMLVGPEEFDDPRRLADRIVRKIRLEATRNTRCTRRVDSPAHAAA